MNRWDYLAVWLIIGFSLSIFFIFYYHNYPVNIYQPIISTSSTENQQGYCGTRIDTITWWGKDQVPHSISFYPETCDV